MDARAGDARVGGSGGDVSSLQAAPPLSTHGEKLIMRKILLPLALTSALAAVAGSAFAFDLGASIDKANGAVDKANAKAQAGLDAGAQAQANASAKVDAKSAEVKANAAGIDAATGLNTSASVDKANTKVQAHKAKAEKSASRAQQKAGEKKAAVNAKVDAGKGQAAEVQATAAGLGVGGSVQAK